MWVYSLHVCFVVPEIATAVHCCCQQMSLAFLSKQQGRKNSMQHAEEVLFPMFNYGRTDSIGTNKSKTKCCIISGFTIIQFEFSQEGCKRAGVRLEIFTSAKQQVGFNIKTSVRRKWNCLEIRLQYSGSFGLPNVYRKYIAPGTRGQGR